MQSSRKWVLFAGCVGAFILILPGRVIAQGANFGSPSHATVVEPAYSERYAVPASPFSRIKNDSNGKGELEEQLRLLLQELKRLKKDAEEKFQKDILPYLKREIEKLRNRLKEFSPGKEQTPEPQRVQA